MLDAEAMIVLGASSLLGGGVYFAALAVFLAALARAAIREADRRP